MTSGNIAVFDHDALRHIDYVSEFHKIFGLNTEPAEACARSCTTPSPPSNRATSTPKRCSTSKR